jgi:hypothetical protein
MARTLPTTEIQHVYNYPVPEKESIQVTRLPFDARGGDTYQVVVDIQAPAETCFDVLTNFELMQRSSSVITEIVVRERTDDAARIEMKVKPEFDTGKFFYRYAFDRKNTMFVYWMESYEGDSPVWDNISVETRIYTFGAFSRVVLTETFLMGKDVPAADATPIFTGIGHDMFNRIKSQL